MRKTFIALVIFLSATISAKSQKAFEGYYIGLKGDTIAGNFPKYKEWINNPGSVNFVENKNNRLVILTPQNAVSFSINGTDNYVFEKILRTINPAEFSGGFDATEKEDIKEQVEVFLHVIYNKNNLQLLELKDQKRVNYFIRHKSDALAELSFKSYVVENHIVEERKYREQLRSLFFDKIASNRDLQSKLDKLEYNDESLSSFLDEVQSQHINKVKGKYPSDLAVFAGVSVNSFIVDGSQDYSPATIKYSTTTAPVFGVCFNTYSKRNFGKNIFSVQLKFYSFKNIGKYYSSEFLPPREYTFKSNILNLGLSYGRNWIHTSLVSWYTSIVAGVNLFMGNKGLVKNENFTTEFGAGKDVFPTGSLKTGVVFKKKFGIWGMYNIPVNVQNNQSFSTRHSALQFGVEYRFRRSKS